jgi:reactive chlorine resistance protein C
MDITDTINSDTRMHVEVGSRAQAVGQLLLRYGLVLVIGWIGLMKFTEYEAKGIQPLVANSPLIGLRHWSAKASAVGSAAAVLMFLTTISFLLSTPGWEPSLGGFPALSALPGQFLLKDVVLLGAAIWSFGEAWTGGARIPTRH